MSQAKLQAARELIEQKNYAEAYQLLKTIEDHPTAAKWLAQLETRYADRIQQKQKSKGKPVKEERAGLAGTFRIVWGILTLLSIGWVCYGITVTASAVNTTTDTVNAQSTAYQAGTAIGAGLSITVFLCTGIPLLLFFGFLYWRNGVAIREARRFNKSMMQ